MSFYLSNGPIVQRTIFDFEDIPLPLAQLPPQPPLPTVRAQPVSFVELPPEPPKLERQYAEYGHASHFTEEVSAPGRHGSPVPHDGMTPGERLRSKQTKIK